MKKPTLNVAISGLGKLGRTVTEHLLAQIQQGANVRIVAAASRKPRSWLQTYDIPWVDDLHLLTQDKNVDVILECMGGVNAANTLVQSALSHGKHVVTANPTLLAAHGKVLHTTAKHQASFLGMEGALNGALPLLDLLRNTPMQTIQATIATETDAALQRMVAFNETYMQASAAVGADATAKSTLYRLAAIQYAAFGTQAGLHAPVGLDVLSAHTLQLAQRLTGEQEAKVVLQGEVTANRVALQPVLKAFADTKHETLEINGAEIKLPAHSVPTAVQGVLHDVQRIANGQTKVQIPAQLMQPIQPSEQTFFIELALADRALLRRDVRWQLLKEETDAKHQTVGALVTTHLSGQQLQAVLGESAFVMPTAGFTSQAGFLRAVA